MDRRWADLAHPGARNGRGHHLGGAPGRARICGWRCGGGTTQISDPRRGGSAEGETVLLSDRSNDRIRAWDVETETLTSLAGGGPPGVDEVGSSAGFDRDGGIVLDGSNLYIADTFSNAIRVMGLNSGGVATLAGQSGVAGTADGPTSSALLDTPQGLALKDGLLYAAGFDGLIRVLDKASKQISTLPVAGLTGTFS